MNLSLAQSTDNNELIEFYKKFPIGQQVEFKIDRRPDFFKPYQIQSDQYVTYVLKDEKQQIHGVASFTFYQTTVAAAPARIAFARDLRISPQREAVLAWSQHYLPVIEEVKNVFNIDYFFSNLDLNDQQVLNTFVRPKPSKRKIPHYHIFRRLNLVSLHGKFPWAPEPLRHLKIRKASSQIQDQLLKYLFDQFSKRDLGVIENTDSFIELLQRWDDLSLDDFYVAIDSKENIRGCCAAWNPGRIQELIPQKYSLQGHNFRQFLKFASPLGWTRKLTKPAYRLQVEAGLDFKYLCFLFADHSDIFESLIWRVYEEARPTEFLVYCQPRSDLHLRKPPHWIGFEQPFGTYAIIRPEEELPSALSPHQPRAITMEPFFL